MQLLAKSIVSAAALSLFLGTPVLASEHHHHLENRGMVTQFVYQTILVDQNGEPVTQEATAVVGDSTTYANVATTAAETPVAEETSVAGTTTTAAAVAPTTTSVAVISIETSSSTTVAPTTTTAVATTSSSTQAAVSSAAPVNKANSDSGSLSYGTTPSSFEDGTIDCSTFPSGNGVISLDWLGMGGWSGIQFDDNGATSTGSSCEEGAYCSYSCQPGMSKTQWPSDQPASGVSIGGLYCKGGKLYRTNTNSDTLCEWGANSAVLKSELSSGVSLCRTDYPGTENMVIPTWLEAGGSEILTVVNEQDYFQWRNGLTSAQYYVNDAGVSVEDGCLWGSSSGTVGNWAPLNIGAGSINGVSWLALIPNPNNRQAASYNVKIVAGDGATVNGDCVYENGLFNGGDSGCTVSVTNGQAYFVFYN
ncbi:putative glucosidase [Starmerella bacillaris]|uniref:Glucosidase n=1 Tax=Starmerella bacillaris TaxID=1247836 RepID=A0AAV5RHB7_STABA|nr:putative glucosidase [Starmerella bacillaris]